MTGIELIGLARISDREHQNTHSEFSRVWQKESNRPRELETEYQKSKSKGGRPYAAHTILIRHFLQRNPESTWSATELNFETWLRTLRDTTNSYSFDGREFEIRVEFDRDEKMYEFEVNGAESDTVRVSAIKDRFNSVKKDIRKQSK